jgi:preprotein translocase subunit SecF
LSSKNEENEAEAIIVEEITSGAEIAPLKYEKIGKIVKERAAKTIACVLVVGFLILLGIPFIYLFTPGAIVADVVDMIKTVSAVLSGTIGAVLGYYFRTTQE